MVILEGVSSAGVELCYTGGVIFSLSCLYKTFCGSRRSCSKYDKCHSITAEDEKNLRV